MKKMKNRKGFTLVELIVVIAILAILAAVAIPVYSNYISKANEAADYSMLDAIKTAVAFKVTEDGVKADPPAAPEITAIEVTTSGVQAKTGTATAYAAVDISDYYTDTISFKSGATKAEWDGAKWTLTKGTTPAPTTSPEAGG